jgi:O-antigen/teichoic acid export membrane protein
MNIFSLPFFAFSITFAHPIVAAWLGKGYDVVAEGIQILALGTYLNLLTAPAYHSLIGIGKPKLGIQFGLLNLILNALVTVILSMKYGFFGAVIGQTIALSVASCYFLIQFHRQQRLPLFKTHWDTFGKPCLFLVIVSIPILQIYRLTAQTFHWNNIVGLIGAYSMYTLLFVLILWRYKILNRHDLEMARSILLGS